MEQTILKVLCLALLLYSCCTVLLVDAAAFGYDSDPCLPKTHGIRKLLTTLMKSQEDKGISSEKILASNFLVSPLSVFLALLLVYPGATGSTKDQLTKVLFHTNNTDNAITLPSCSGGLAPFGVVNAEMSKFVDTHIYFRALFDSSVRLSADYVGRLKDAFAVLATSEELVGKEEQLNQEIAKATNDRIKNMLGPGTFNDASKLVLINALYFKAKWLDKFPEASTVDADFFNVGRSNSKKVKMMSNFLSHATHGTIGSDISYLELPYYLADFAMVLFKGVSRQLLDEHGFNFRKQLFSSKSKRVEKIGKVNLKMPKFTFTTETMNLKSHMQTLGLTDLFDPLKADLSAITEGGDQSVTIDSVLHKGFIKVDENGTEAAAVTVLVGVGASFDPSEPVDFVFDEPFAFAIVHKLTKLVLFEGYLGDPTAE